ncbi:hypothetical protein YQE_05477, partial [Dendroctonus ponderosae]
MKNCKKMVSNHSCYVSESTTDEETGDMEYAPNSRQNKLPRKPTRTPKCFSKNALMARENRLKKKMYITTLESQVASLSADNKKMTQLHQNQSVLVKELKNEVKYLKSVLGNSEHIGKLIRAINFSTGIPIKSSIDRRASPSSRDAVNKSPIAQKIVPNGELPQEIRPETACVGYDFTRHPWDETEKLSQNNINFPTPESTSSYYDNSDIDELKKSLLLDIDVPSNMDVFFDDIIQEDLLEVPEKSSSSGTSADLTINLQEEEDVGMNFAYYCAEVFCILALFLAKYLWRKSRKCAAEGLQGPKRLPLLGNALTVWCKDEDIFENLVECFSKYPSPMRFDIFQQLFIIFREPAQVEKIFSTSALTAKDDIYKFIKYFDGEGLISGSGAKWKKDKRLLSPLFLKRNIVQYFGVMLNHAQILAGILEQEADRPAFDIQHYLHRAVADIVNETIIGVQTNAQCGELDDFLSCIGRGYQLVHERMVKPWLQVEFIFRLTPKYKELTQTRQVLRQVKKSHSHLGPKEIACRTILEQMLDIRDEVPDFSTDEELIHHMTTFYSASEDTATSICSFALVMMGMYPEYQKRVVEEMHSVIGCEELREEHLQRLDELQMVLKETLRLFPIAPLLLRKVSQNIEIDGFNIPAGTSLVVSIQNIHRDPRFWAKPNDFYPEHFLPEAVKKRHPYAYLPFSAGARGCIGKPYAYMIMKTLLVTILRKYSVEAVGSLQDKPITADISVRFKDHSYAVRIMKRV